MSATPEPYRVLVETERGELVRKLPGDLLPDDKVIFDGPEAFASIAAAQSALESEIEAAGGLEAWRAGMRMGAPSSGGSDGKGESA